MMSDVMQNVNYIPLIKWILICNLGFTWNLGSDILDSIVHFSLHLSICANKLSSEPIVHNFTMNNPRSKCLDSLVYFISNAMNPNIRNICLLQPIVDVAPLRHSWVPIQVTKSLCIQNLIYTIYIYPMIFNSIEAWSDRFEASQKEFRCQRNRKYFDTDC